MTHSFTSLEGRVKPQKQLRVDPLPQTFARFKGDHTAFADFHGRAGPGIPADPGILFPDIEGTELDQLDGILFEEAAFHPVKDGIDQLSGTLLGETQFLVNGPGQVLTS
jgi:hypothetical protein